MLTLFTKSFHHQTDGMNVKATVAVINIFYKVKMFALLRKVLHPDFLFEMNSRDMFKVTKSAALTDRCFSIY